MDQLIPFAFTLITLAVLVRILLQGDCLERDRRVDNSDLLRPVA